MTKSDFCLRTLRRNMNWSVAGMANYLGCTPHELLSWESCNQCPPEVLNRKLVPLKMQIENTIQRLADAPSADQSLMRENRVQLLAEYKGA